MQAEHLHSNSNDESSSPPSRAESAATSRNVNPGSESSNGETGNVYAQNLELQQEEIVLPTDTNEGGKKLSIHEVD